MKRKTNFPEKRECLKGKPENMEGRLLKSSHKLQKNGFEKGRLQCAP